MKRIYSFMVAAVAMFAAAACTQELENVEPEVKGETVVYTASTDGADTKAVLNETTKKSEWVAGDAITVHDETKGWTFTTAEAGADVDFSNSEGFGDYRPVLAVYPAGTYTADVEAKTVKANIPTWQQAQAGTYNSSAALAVAYTEDDTFAFKNAHALLKFTVNTDNVTHVIFHGNGSEAITGDVNVTLGQDGIESVECLETEFTEQQWNEETQQNEDVIVEKYGTWVECYAWDDNELIDDPSDDTNYFAKGQTYYIAVAPQTFNGGVTVKVRIDKGEELVAKTTTKPVETKINTILNLGEIEYEAPVVHEWAIAGTFNEWSTTANPMELVDGYYVAKNVTGLNYSEPNVGETGSSTGIKFVNNGTWRGGEGQVTAGTWAYVWGDGGSNIYVAGATAGTAYDIYLNPSEGDHGKFVIVAADAEMPEDTPEVVEKEWGIVGTMTDWSDNIPMTLVDGWYVAENVTIKTSDEFKFRVGTTWDELKTYNSTTIVANTEYTTVDGQGDGNGMKVAVSAIYSVYLSADAATMKVVKTGDIPLPEVKNWGIAGSMTNWTDGNDIVMSLVGDWYIAEDVEMPAGTTFKFRVDNDWAIQLTYAASEIVEGELYSVAKGNDNITVKVSAIYDVYLSRDETTMKIVKVGEYVAPEPEPEPEDGKTIYLNAGGSSLWDQADAYFDVWHWKAGGDGSWVTMKASSTAGVYECKIAQESDMVIFVRKNPSSTAQSWTGVWNQTADLTIPAGKNMYTITGWGNTDGTWSTK